MSAICFWLPGSLTFTLAFSKRPTLPFTLTPKFEGRLYFAFCLGKANVYPLFPLEYLRLLQSTFHTLKCTIWVSFHKQNWSITYTMIIYDNRDWIYYIKHVLVSMLMLPRSLFLSLCHACAFTHMSIPMYCELWIIYPFNDQRMKRIPIQVHLLVEKQLGFHPFGKNILYCSSLGWCWFVENFYEGHSIYNKYTAARNSKQHQASYLIHSQL